MTLWNTNGEQNSTPMFKIALVLLCICLVHAQDDKLYDSGLYSPENTLKFANYLFEQKEYKRAAFEYQRYTFISSSSSDSIDFKIGLCYYQANSMQTAIDYWRSHMNMIADSDWQNKTRFYIAYSLFKQRKFDEENSYVKTILSEKSSGNLIIHARALLFCSRLLQRDWTSAQKHLTGHKTTQLSDTSRSRFKDLLHEGKTLKYKNPLLAASLSSVVPGLGKVYSGRAIDGIFSFLLHGFMFWQAWSGFSQDNIRSTKGWFFSGLGSVFYMGNIYGSYISAKIHNKKLSHAYDNKVYFELRTTFGH